MSLFAKLMGSATATPAQAEEAAPASALTEAQIEAGLQAAKAEGHAEGLAAGAKAERERTAAVFASEEGKANMSMAAWMLGASPTATAEQIVAQLKDCPVQAAAAPAVPAAGHAERAQGQLAAAPKVDLNGGKPAQHANDGGDGSSNPWDQILPSEGKDAPAGMTTRRGG